MDDADLVPVFLMIQFVALPGAVFLGWFANKIGQKNALHICLAVWVRGADQRILDSAKCGSSGSWPP